jgi:hypothetical protein
MEDIELGYRILTQHGMEIVFMPTAVAHHLHPMTVRDSCRRMVKVGYSSRLAHQLWPELGPPPAPSRKLRWADDPLIHNTQLMNFMIIAGDFLTRFWCPNPLLQRLLKLHYRIGYCDHDAERAL